MMVYVGIPYVDKGRAREGGLDCWGLVRLFHMEQSGIELPMHAEISAEALIKIAHAAKADLLEIWRDVSAEPRQRLDLVVMKRIVDVGSIPLHCGVMLDRKTMLHTEVLTDSHTTLIRDPNVARRILGFYRHKDLP